MPKSPKSPKNKPVPKSVLNIKGKAKEKLNLSATPSPTASPRLKPKRKRNKNKAAKGQDEEVAPEIVDLAWDETEDVDLSVEGSATPAPIAGPSRLPDTTPRPTMFTPLPRSLVSGLDITLSPSPSPIKRSTPLPVTPTAELEDGAIVIDDIPPAPSLDSSSTPSKNSTAADKPSSHFNPPGLFSTSMIPEIVSSGIEHAKVDDVRKSSEKKNENGLLLPSHVMVDTPMKDENGDISVEVDVMEEEDMEGVHVVDDDLSRGVPRYFLPTSPERTEEATFLATADQSQMCRNCKRPGHKERDCPHVICTTCGAEDDHERRNCPVSLVCFGCGERGHRKVDCPDPVSRTSRRTGCDRCGSWDHMENTCPSIWRIYIYRSDRDRRHVKDEKDRAKGWAKEAIGGEPREEWCYNCSLEGHLGDDCQLRRGSLARATAASAFSYTNASRGPFTSSSRHNHSSSPSRRDRSYHTSYEMSAPRSHQRFDDDSDLPYTNPGFQGGAVGKKGKDKEKQRWLDRDRRDRDGDEDDWFGGRNGSRTPQTGRGRNDRPWDSEHRSNGRQRDGRSVSPQRKGNSSTKSKSQPRSNLPFGHSHLISGSGPQSAPAKAIVFGKLNLPGSPAPSPSANGHGSAADSPSLTKGKAPPRQPKKMGNPALAVVQRALDNTPLRGPRHRDRHNQDSPLSQNTPSGPSRRQPDVPYDPRNNDGDHRGTPMKGGSAKGTPASGSTRKDRRKRAHDRSAGGGGGQGVEKDWESEWRRSGEGGGNVASWGKDFDQLDKRIANDTSKGSSKTKVSGQRYHGGY